MLNITSQEVKKMIKNTKELADIVKVKQVFGEDDPSEKVTKLLNQGGFY